MEATQPRIPYKDVDGFKLPMRFPEERFREAVSYIPVPGDIFLGSYPKTGSTWLNYVVYLIATKAQRPDDVVCLLASTPYVQRDGLYMKDAESYLGSVGRIALKYQMPFNLMPFSREAKYIYIARNPKDTCVSFYNFTKAVPGYNFQNGSFDDFFNMFLSGDLPFGDYMENVLSWYEHEGEKNFLFVTFEEMKTNIRSVILKVADFMDRPLEPGDVDQIEHYSSFEYMKRHIDNQLQVYLNISPECFHLKHLEISKKSKGHQELGPNLVRKGEVHQWKTYFNEKQNETLNRAFFERARGTKAVNLWSDILEAREY